MSIKPHNPLGLTAEKWDAMINRIRQQEIRVIDCLVSDKYGRKDILIGTVETCDRLYRADQREGRMPADGCRPK